MTQQYAYDEAVMMASLKQHRLELSRRPLDQTPRATIAGALVPKAKLDRVLTMAAEHSGATPKDIMSQRRGVTQVNGRAFALTVLARLGYGLMTLSRTFGLHHTSVLHAIRKDQPESFEAAVNEAVERMQA